MRKSKALIALLAAVMCLSGCGAKTETAETEAATTTKAAETTTKAETEATTTAVETTEATTTTEAPPKEFPKLKTYNNFENGCMTFYNDNQAYALNLVDKKIYKYDNKSVKVSFVGGNIASTYEDGVYNFATGEMNEYEILNYLHVFSDYNPVYKIDESFDGNVCYFGVMDRNGEMVLPLSSEYVICKQIEENESGLYYCSDSLCYDAERYANKIINYKDNKVYNTKDMGYMCCLSVSGDNALIGNWSGKYYTDVAKLNTKTGEITPIFENAGNKYDYRYMTGYKHGMTFASSEKGAVILDRDYNVMNYDLSAYYVLAVYDCTENYVLFASNNDKGDRYIIILDKDGNRVIEPVKGEGGRNSYICGDYVVIIDMSKKDYIIDLKTGDIRVFEDKNTYDIEKFDVDSGFMLVKAGKGYYLADPADPDTLINPLEFAE
ncbi:MAG: hypothetical protein ACI4J7_04635 [Ruminiclostridium sp.]